MSRDWIGISDDLNESGVVGTPYTQTSTTIFPNPGASVSPSGMGGAKKALIVAGILAVAAITPPGKAILAAIEGKLQPKHVPVERQPVEYDDEGEEPHEQPARSAPTASQKKAAEPVASVAPRKKAVEPAPKKPTPKPQPAPSRSLPAAPEGEGTTDTPAPAVEPEIDLTKFRNLTGRT